MNLVHTQRDDSPGGEGATPSPSPDVRPVSAIWRQRHVLLATFDLLIVTGCFLMAYVLRFDTSFWR